MQTTFGKQIGQLIFAQTLRHTVLAREDNDKKNRLIVKTDSDDDLHQCGILRLKNCQYT